MHIMHARVCMCMIAGVCVCVHVYVRSHMYMSMCISAFIHMYVWICFFILAMSYIASMYLDSKSLPQDDYDNKCFYD